MGSVHRGPSHECRQLIHPILVAHSPLFVQPSKAMMEMLLVCGLEGAVLEERESCEHIFCQHD